MSEELEVRNASPRLRPYVERCWGYHERTAAPTRRREPASTGVVVILGLDAGLRLVDRNDPARPSRRLRSFVAGLDDGCAVIEHDGEMHGVQVDLTPLAARMVFGVPMHELAHEAVALDDVLGSDGRRLEERVAGAQPWEERFAMVESALGTRLAAADPPPPDVAWAWQRLRSTHGSLRVSELAAELGCSRKHLAVRFRDHVGVPPKLAARVFRFRRAFDLLGSPTTPSIAEVAAASGYYDQAHLDRDFRDFAGMTPSALIAEARTAVTFVQDDASRAA